jgi:hypothetical protein
MHFDPQHTALVITDAQVDLPSPESVAWDLVGEQVERNQVVEHLVALKSAAKRAATTADRPGAILNGIKRQLEQGRQPWPRCVVRSRDR